MNDATKESPAQVEPAAGTSVAPIPQGQPPSTGALFVKVFPSIMLPMFLAVADQTIVATALPAIASGLGEIERASWVVVSYLIANTIAAPVYGRLGDTFGRRGMMILRWRSSCSARCSARSLPISNSSPPPACCKDSAAAA